MKSRSPLDIMLKSGMDVHRTSYTLRVMEPVINVAEITFPNSRVTPDYKNVLQLID